MLVGVAASNVHDGDRDLGDNFILKGIPTKSEIGFLTYFEHFGHFKVGELLKIPPVPIWIIDQDVKKIGSGKLADVAPTILDLMGIKKPVEMTGSSLISL